MKTHARKVFPFIRSLAIAAVAAILFWTLILMVFEEHFIYFPTGYPGGLYDQVPPTLGVEDHWFTAEDGVRLHGWLVRHETPVATLIMAHGNAGNISHRLDLIRRLRQTGFTVFIFDYRGYGRSEGSPGESGVYKDGRAAFDHVVRLEGIDSARIILFGTSLGGAVATDVATQRPGSALILESTFTSARDMAK
ncbi:MAG: alpha/beta fold hydrolase, partial [Bacteroidota bacterium]